MRFSNEKIEVAKTSSPGAYLEVSRIDPPVTTEGADAATGDATATGTVAAATAGSTAMTAGAAAATATDAAAGTGSTAAGTTGGATLTAGATGAAASCWAALPRLVMVLVMSPFMVTATVRILL